MNARRSYGDLDSVPRALLRFLHFVLASGAFDGKTRDFRQRPLPLEVRLGASRASVATELALGAGRLRARATGRGGRAAAEPRCHGCRNSEVGTQVGTARAFPASLAHLIRVTMRFWPSQEQ
jgi:hypothetical protein